MTKAATVRTFAKGCVRCNRTIEDARGSRVVLPKPVLLHPRVMGAGGPIKPARRGEAGKEPKARGQDAPAWKEREILEAVRAAVYDLERGLVPWVCQRCLGMVCAVCAAPLSFPPGTELYDEAGRVWRAPRFGGHLGCVNSGCSNYRRPDA